MKLKVLIRRGSPDRKSGTSVQIVYSIPFAVVWRLARGAILRARLTSHDPLSSVVVGSIFARLAAELLHLAAAVLYVAEFPIGDGGSTAGFKALSSCSSGSSLGSAVVLRADTSGDGNASSFLVQYMLSLTSDMDAKTWGNEPGSKSGCGDAMERKSEYCRSPASFTPPSRFRKLKTQRQVSDKASVIWASPRGWQIGNPAVGWWLCVMLWFPPFVPRSSLFALRLLTLLRAVASVL